MNIAAEQVIRTIWQVGIALAAGIPILTMIGVWLVTRLSKPLDAYSEERAKLFAQSHNIETLIEQTKTLTATTEAIKAQLSAQEWGRQQRWLKRLDCYTDVVEKLAAYENAAIVVQAKEQALSALGVPEDDPKMILSVRGSGIGPYNDAVSALTHATSVAELVSAEKPLSILRHFRLPIIDFSNSAATVGKGGELAASVSKAFVIAAREDLGYEPLSRH
jgi:hypothetical protein